MKTFTQFQEDVDSMKATMKGFADTIVPQMKNFAKSKEVKDLKKNAMNMLINKGYEALDKGKKKLLYKNYRTNEKLSHLLQWTVFVQKFKRE